MTHPGQTMLEELQRRHYAYRTSNTHIRIVRDFAAYFRRPPDELGPETIRRCGRSQVSSALRFF
jgi:hypothetical protein